MTTIENGMEETIKYSYPARIYFESSSSGSVNYNNYRKGLSGLALECTNAKDEAKQYADEANKSAKNAQTSERNAEYALSQMKDNVLPQHIATHFRLDKQTFENDILAGFVDFYFNGENHRYMLSTKNATEFSDGQYKLQIYKDLSIDNIAISKNEMQDYITIAVVTVDSGFFYDLWTFDDEYLYERYDTIVRKIKMLENEINNRPDNNALNETIKSLQTRNNAVFANALTTNIDDTSIVRCDDVSPVEHKLGVVIHGNTQDSLSVSNPKVSVFGKNLCYFNEINSKGYHFLKKRLSLRIPLFQVCFPPQITHIYPQEHIRFQLQLQAVENMSQAKHFNCDFSIIILIQHYHLMILHRVP